MRRPLLLAAACLAALAATAQAASLGPQRQVSRPAAGHADAPAIAPGARSALVAWVRRPSENGGEDESEVWARRVDGAGRPLGAPVRLSRMGRRGAGPPAVAWSPATREWLVAWSGSGPSERTGPCPDPPGGPAPNASCRITDREVYLRRVRRDGRPAGPQRRLTTTGAPDRTDAQASGPSIAWSPRAGGWLVSWTANPKGGFKHSQVRLRRLDRRARPDGPERRVTAHRAGIAAGELAVDHRSGAVLLAYALIHPVPAGSEVYARPLDAGGRPSGRARRLTEPGGTRDSLGDAVALRRGFLVSLERRGGAPPFSEVQVIRLGRDGRPSGSARPVPGASPETAPESSLAAAPGGGALIAFTRLTVEDREVHANAISARGVPARRSFRVSRMGSDRSRLGSDRRPEQGEQPALAALGPGHLAAWSGLDRGDRAREVHARRVRR